MKTLTRTELEMLSDEDFRAYMDARAAESDAELVRDIRRHRLIGIGLFLFLISIVPFIMIFGGSH